MLFTEEIPDLTAEQLERVWAWIRALESGDYQQAQHRLTKIDHEGNITNCCLGVLCDLEVKRGKMFVHRETYGSALIYKLDETDHNLDGFITTPPMIVTREYGLATGDGALPFKMRPFDSLAVSNWKRDGHGDRPEPEDDLPDDESSLVALNDTASGFFDFLKIADILRWLHGLPSRESELASSAS